MNLPKIQLLFRIDRKRVGGVEKMRIHRMKMEGRRGKDFEKKGNTLKREKCA